MNNFNFRILIPTMLVIVSVVGAVSMVMFMQKEQHLQPAVAPVSTISVEGNNATPTGATAPLAGEVASDVSGWKNYENKEYGFAFKYPPEWGEVLVKPSNKGNGRLVCNGAGMMWGPREEFSNPLYDAGISFSNLSTTTDPTVFIQVLRFSKKEHQFMTCNIPNAPKVVFDVFVEQEKFATAVNESSQSLSRHLFTNASGIGFLYYPDMLDGEDSGQFYQAYGDEFEVEGHMMYQPTTDAQQEEWKTYYDECGSGVGSYVCPQYGKWMRGGETSVGIRRYFTDFHRVMDTFTIK